MAPKETDYLEIAHQRAIEKKTHVSFPQLKYPSLRDEGLRDPVQWLQGKSMDDGAEGLWRVHDRLYDLGEFVESHPGGAEWLELTMGTDITEAFESHHISSIAGKTLPRFYIRDAKTPRNSPFTFKEDGFYRTLKRLVRDEIEKVPKESLKYSDMLTDGLFGTLLVASALTCWASNYWVFMGFYFMASLSLAWLTVAAHNYIHKRTNWRMYYFNLSLWSYRIIPIFLRDGFFTKHIRWHDLIGFLLPFWMYLGSGASFSHVLTTWIGIICGGSSIFYLIGANAAHHHPKIFKDGDQVSDVTIDWGMHELEAVMDRPTINDSHFKVMTFFGHHALHHLFPTLDHAVLEYLYPVFLRHCEKHKANFRLASQLELFIGQIKMTLKTEPSLLSERYNQ